MSHLNVTDGHFRGSTGNIRQFADFADRNFTKFRVEFVESRSPKSDAVKLLIRYGEGEREGAGGMGRNPMKSVTTTKPRERIRLYQMIELSMHSRGQIRRATN